MKEFKVAERPFGFNNVHKKIEDFLNQHAVQGWTVVHVAPNLTTFIIDREKNR